MMTDTFALRADHLGYAYGAETVLHDVSLTLPRGTVTVIAGPNGAGKSTLLEILAGVRRPLTGRVRTTAAVALVVQRTTTPETLPLTVADVVRMGTWRGRGTRSRSAPGVRRAERSRAIAEALTRVDLADLAHRPFTALSGGQRQRALVAQAIARRAPILLLDEPSTGLDAASRDRTRMILAEEAARGAAVAMVTHDPEAIDGADAIIRLVDGARIAEPHPAARAAGGPAS